MAEKTFQLNKIYNEAILLVKEPLVMKHEQREDLLNFCLKNFYNRLEAHIRLHPNDIFYFGITSLYRSDYHDKMIYSLRDDGFYEIKFRKLLDNYSVELEISPDNWTEPKSKPLNIYSVTLLPPNFRDNGNVFKTIVVCAASEQKAMEVTHRENSEWKIEYLMVKHIGTALPEMKEGIIPQEIKN